MTNAAPNHSTVARDPTMLATTSEARINSNRLNALKSTGPKTPEGKENSRRNGLKHGLTGAGIVVAEEDAPEVDRRAGALMAELDPKSTLGKVLVGQIATLSVRMERGAKREEEALAGRVRHATESFDHGRVDGVEYLFDALADDPRRCVRLLRRSTEGVDRLLEAWSELGDLLTRSEISEGWDTAHQSTAAHLLGLREDQARGSLVDRLSMAVRGEGSLADPSWVALDDRARRDYARDRLVDLIAAEIAGLEDHRESLDLEAIALDREGAADLALFDDSPEAARARRYEAEARRGFFKALEQLRQAEAEAAERAARQAESMPRERLVYREVASSCGRPSPAPREPEPAPVEAAARSAWVGDGSSRGLDGRVLAVGRAVVMPG